jgi:uncharacterized membrane protein
MTGKSVWAIVAGVIAVVVVTTLVDGVLHLAGMLPAANERMDDARSALALSYRIVIGVGGGYLAARLAPERPMTHALILGVVGTILGLIGVVATWNLDLGPRWYPIAVFALAIPQCWAGGALFERRLRRA